MLLLAQAELAFAALRDRYQMPRFGDHCPVELDRAFGQLSLGLAVRSGEAELGEHRADPHAVRAHGKRRQIAARAAAGEGLGRGALGEPRGFRTPNERGYRIGENRFRVVDLGAFECFEACDLVEREIGE